MSIPVKKVKDTSTLYTRGVLVSHINFLRNNFKKQGFKTIGEFLNALITKAKKGE